MKILITGSSGMIGTALAAALRQDGHAITGLDKKPSSDIANFAQHDLLLPIEGAVLEHLREGSFDLIVHLAAHARVIELVHEPEKALDNIRMTHTVFEFARQYGVSKVLFASSRETYGTTKQRAVEEMASQRRVENLYAASKIAGEAYGHAYRSTYGIDGRIVRFSNVYGRFDHSDRFIPLAIRALREGKPFRIYGTNRMLDFIFLDDAVDALVLLIRYWEGNGLEHDEYNVASGRSDRLHDVALALRSILGSTSEVTVAEPTAGEVTHFEGDISRMRSLGWSPIISLSEGLHRAVEYYTPQS